MEIKTLEIAGLVGVLNAVRLPHNKPALSKTAFSCDIEDIADTTGALDVQMHSRATMEHGDLNLISTLVRRGDEHAKVIRGMIVWAEIAAPVYWWCEMETYRIGHERLSSESTMHGVAKGMTGDELVRTKSELPMGTMLKKVDYFSYQTLRRIYQQRKDHRLPEWHRFCDWIKTLPFAQEFILTGIE